MLVAIIESIALNDMNTNDCEKKNKVKFIKQEKHMKKVKIMKEPDSANSISRILPFLISIKEPKAGFASPTRTPTAST